MSDLESNNADSICNASVNSRSYQRRQGHETIPIFTILITTINWLTYIYGIVFIIKWSNVDLSTSSPVSPPIRSWYYYTVTSWPNCNDARTDISRVFTYQFVHGTTLYPYSVVLFYFDQTFSTYFTASPMHIMGNTLAGVAYGCVFNCYIPGGFWDTGLVYTAAVVLGGLGHSLIWPFKGLIGCSPGVYGMIGGCWIVWIFHNTRLHPLIAFVLPFALCAQMAGDVAAYLLFYTSSIEYASHFFGFCTGVTLTLALLCFEYKATGSYQPIPPPTLASYARRVMGIIGAVGFIIQAVYMIHHYLTSWPPQAWERSFLHNTNSTTCCEQLFIYAAQTGLTTEAIQQNSYCSGDMLYRYY